jgi:cytochrome c oxidase subunit 3
MGDAHHGNGGGGDRGSGWSFRSSDGGREGWPLPAARIALWLFLATASVLFLMLVSAYAVRVGWPDWRSVPLPEALWWNTGFLLVSSGVFEWIRRSSRGGDPERLRLLFLAAGTWGILFLVGQLLAWRQLHTAGYGLAVNPASSFFYLLTALHGLHLLGGLVAWGWTTVQIWSRGATSTVRARAELCAIYWHFLLLVWLLIVSVLWFKS